MEKSIVEQNIATMTVWQSSLNYHPRICLPCR